MKNQTDNLLTIQPQYCNQTALSIMNTHPAFIKLGGSKV